MPNTKFTVLAKLLSAVVLAVIAPSSFAASTWSSGALTNCVNGSSAAFATSANGNIGRTSLSCGSGSGTDLNLSSVSTAISGGAGTSFAAAGTLNNGSPNGISVVNKYENNNTGPHATDNAVGIDATLLSFGGAVNLSGITIGWNGSDNGATDAGISYSDSDMSLLAWTGTAACSASGKTSGGASCGPTLLSTTISSSMAGWTLISSYSNVGASNGNIAGGTQLVATGVYSSYWLVSAFSSTYGSSSITDSTVDAFKLMSVAGNRCDGARESITGSACTTSRVPEPGSLALMGAGLIGFMVSRRRKPAALAA